MLTEMHQLIQFRLDHQTPVESQGVKQTLVRCGVIMVTVRGSAGQSDRCNVRTPQVEEGVTVQKRRIIG